jgi:hypothetical protein
VSTGPQLLAKMESWLVDRGTAPAGATRVLAFPEDDVRIMAEYVRSLQQPHTLGSKLTTLTLKKAD